MAALFELCFCLSQARLDAFCITPRQCGSMRTVDRLHPLSHLRVETLRRASATVAANFIFSLLLFIAPLLWNSFSWQRLYPVKNPLLWFLQLTVLCASCAITRTVCTVYLQIGATVSLFLLLKQSQRPVLTFPCHYTLQTRRSTLCEITRYCRETDFLLPNREVAYSCRHGDPVLFLVVFLSHWMNIPK